MNAERAGPPESVPTLTEEVGVARRAARQCVARAKSKATEPTSSPAHQMLEERRATRPKQPTISQP